MKLRKRRAEKRFQSSKVMQKFEEKAAALDAATIAGGGEPSADAPLTTVANAANGGNGGGSGVKKEGKDNDDGDGDNRSKSAAATARNKKKKKENADIDFKAVFDDDGIIHIHHTIAICHC